MSERPDRTRADLDPRRRESGLPSRHGEPSRHPLNDQRLLSEGRLLGEHRLLAEHRLLGIRALFQPGELEASLRDSDKRGDALRGCDRDRNIVHAVLTRLGIEADLDEPFGCVVVGHTSEELSACLVLDESGAVKYRDQHAQTPGRFVFTLPEVFASEVAGRPMVLKGPSHAVWRLRLLLESGVVPAPDLGLAVPADLSPRGRTIYEGVVLLAATRDLAGTLHEGVPLSRVFLSQWTGLSETEAEAGKRELIDRGLIVGMGGAGRPGHPRLWLPEAMVL